LVGSPQVSIGIKLAYGLGKAAEGIKTRVFEFFLFFYYVQVLGLSGTLAGAAVAVALCCDAITDPVAGSLSDRHHSRLGRRHPFMYAAIAPLGVSFYLLFVPPDSLGQFGLFAWLAFFAVAVRSSLTLFHVPYLSLGAELSSDYDERTSIAMARTLCAIFGSIFALILGMNYFFRSTPAFENGQLNAAAYPPFALICAVAMMLLIFACAHWTRSEIYRLPKAPESPPPFSITQVYREMGGALRNPSFRALFTGLILFAVTIGVNATLSMHVATYYWELSPGQISLFIISGGAGFGVSLLFVRYIQSWLDKRRAFLLALAGAAVFGALPPALRELGTLPPNESWLLLPTVLGFFGTAAFFGGLAGVLGASMMADVADQHEYQTGLRQEGVFFGAASFSGKFSSAIGHLVAGAGLDLIGFPKDVMPGEVAPLVISHLGLFGGPGAALPAVVAMAFFARYTITREEHAQIQAELMRRRSERSPGGVEAAALSGPAETR
jgi:GPH family glycoside/pentoside/hexuronide:cation symporter